MALRVVIGQGLADLDSVSVAGSCRRRLAVGVCVFRLLPGPLLGSAVGVVSVAPKIHIVESIGSCASACENKHTCVLCIGSHVGFCCGF